MYSMTFVIPKLQYYKFSEIPLQKYDCRIQEIKDFSDDEEYEVKVISRNEQALTALSLEIIKRMK